MNVILNLFPLLCVFVTNCTFLPCLAPPNQKNKLTVIKFNTKNKKKTSIFSKNIQKFLAKNQFYDIIYALCNECKSIIKKSERMNKMNCKVEKKKMQMK